MKKNGTLFIGYVVAGAFISVVEILSAFLWFNEASSSILSIFLKVGVSGALFIGAAVALIGRKGLIFDSDYARLEGESATYASVLSALGDVPIRSLLAFVLLQLAYLGALFGIPGFIPIAANLRVPAFVMYFSLGMMNGALVYVLSDRLSTRMLLGHALHRYPASLRDNRQQTKIFVIPAFIMLMSLAFAFSLASLVFARSGGSLSSIASHSVSGIALSLTAYLTVVVVLIRIWNRNTGRIYQAIIHQLDQLASAEKDISQRIDIASVDELGSIAGLVNDFCSTLTGNIDDLKSTQRELSGSGATLQESAKTAGVAVARIVSGISLVKEKARSQISSVSESSSAVQQVAKNIESLDRLIGEQAASITEASSSIEEMVGTIGSINASIDRMASQFTSLGSSARTGTEIQRANGVRVNEIAERSNALLEANKVIATIAAQTNLLAMNAAIEAAHAGEAGAGFSVVADEIRRLAETSAKESRTIKTEISFVQSAMGEMVASSRKAEDSFRAVAERIGSTDALVREIQSAIGEQKEGASQILEALREMNDITAQVRNGSQEMKSGNGIIVEEMARLQNDAREIDDGMREMAVGAGDIENGSRQITEIAASTGKSIGEMSQVVGSFRT